MRPPGVEGHLPHMLTPPGTRGFPTSARPKLARPSACVARALPPSVASARARMQLRARVPTSHRNLMRWVGTFKPDPNTVGCVLVVYFGIIIELDLAVDCLNTKRKDSVASIEALLSMFCSLLLVSAGLPKPVPEAFCAPCRSALLPSPKSSTSP